MPHLATPISLIKSHYAVVVVGSGYGGGIAASRLARAGQSVCVLERGKEFRPGQYPDTLAAGVREMQFDTPIAHFGPRTGLYDVRVNPDMNVVLGCGLGGTSLINGNVSLPADPRVFDDSRWPQALRGQPHELEPFYERARAMLQPVPYPDTAPPLRKLQALEDAAHALAEGSFYRPPLTVTFHDGINQAGVAQKACVGCGNCCSGCNYSAKNTTLMNYLPDAYNFGAEIFTQVRVSHLEQGESCWRVHCEVIDGTQDSQDAPVLVIQADVVVLAAGTLGSTEILLRSRDRGLCLSSRLGQAFTGNGDVLGFGYNSEVAINGVGWGTSANQSDPSSKKGGEPVGPTITGMIDLRDTENLEAGMVIGDGVIPSPLRYGLPVAFAVAAAVLGRHTNRTLLDKARKHRRTLESLLLGAYRGAVHNTQTYLVMSHDDACGVMSLDSHDRLRIAWPKAGQHPSLQAVDARLRRATEASGGTYIPNPLWTKWMSEDLVTVHPLGGCPMGDDSAHGVVNHKGQVFNPEPATEDGEPTVYRGLYVCDGAVIPRSLGVNPLLTISALAERSIALLAEDHGWAIQYDACPPARADKVLTPAADENHKVRDASATTHHDTRPKFAFLRKVALALIALGGGFALLMCGVGVVAAPQLRTAVRHPASGAQRTASGGACHTD